MPTDSRILYFWDEDAELSGWLGDGRRASFQRTVKEALICWVNRHSSRGGSSTGKREWPDVSVPCCLFGVAADLQQYPQSAYDWACVSLSFPATSDKRMLVHSDRKGYKLEAKPVSEADKAWLLNEWPETKLDSSEEQSLEVLGDVEGSQANPIDLTDD